MGYNTITGGFQNTVRHSGKSFICNECIGFSTIDGGRCNEICAGNYSSISGGFCNYIGTACNASISGGCCNLVIISNNQFIGGGIKNTVWGDKSSMIGGQENFVNCLNSSMIGGVCNNSYSCNSHMIGGLCNITNCNCNNIVIGGFKNVSCNESTVIGGICNIAQNSSVIVGGICFNCSLCNGTTIGGCNNCNDTFLGTIIGSGNARIISNCNTCKGGLIANAGGSIINTYGSCFSLQHTIIGGLSHGIGILQVVIVVMTKVSCLVGISLQYLPRDVLFIVLVNVPQEQIWTQLQAVHLTG